MAQRKHEVGVMIIAYIFVGAMVIFTLYPVVYTIVGSFKSNMELTLGGGFLPKAFTFNNYIEAFTKAGFATYTWNSVVVSSAVTFFVTLTAAMSGFVFARYPFKGKKFFVTLFISLMFVNLGSITMYPTYRVLLFFKLTGSLWGLIISMIGGQGMNILLITGFSKSIPKELDEAAIMDGAGMLQIFFRILLPMMRPILAVIALFAFRGAWNDYIWTMIMTISNPKLRTLAVGVVQLRYDTSAASRWDLMVAGSAIAVIPILIVYVFAHKQFISSMVSGAIKG
jgi:ABC-type glycerol-3-phosphate transport system permease component